jgi:hypothetical protein
MYIAKQWGNIDFRRFEVLFNRIRDESPHLPWAVNSVYIIETEFNDVVHNLVFDSNDEVRGPEMDEVVERQMQIIEEQWGSEMRTLVFEAFKELEEYARAHPDLNFRVLDNLWTPYNTGSNEVASYEDAARYIAAVVKAIMGLANECACSRYHYQDDDMMPSEDQDYTPSLADDDDPMPPLQDDVMPSEDEDYTPSLADDDDPMPPLQDDVMPEDDDYEDLNWESTRVEDEIYHDPEAVYYQHYGYG